MDSKSSNIKEQVTTVFPKLNKNKKQKKESNEGIKKNYHKQGSDELQKKPVNDKVQSILLD